MATEIIHPHITTKKDTGGDRPIIKHTRTRVANIISYYKLGYTSEELARAFPHLSLSQIYDALSYYHDNKSKIDTDIEANKEENFINHAL
jgi:uncharacterized protein (DUF433 family)